MEFPSILLFTLIFVGKYNPCSINNGNCSHLCLLSMNETYKCACPHIMILTSDNLTCKGMSMSLYLLFSRNHMQYFM